MDRPKIAFVVQRCGREVNGGAEAHCLTMACKMNELWDVEILTTCAVDYITWADYYSEGVENIDGVPVRRFHADSQRVKEEFDTYSEYIRRNISSVTEEECEKWMKLQGPVSTDLLNYIKTNKDHYDGFIFFTYLYCTSYYGLPLVSEKACLVPTAHDEWPIYLPVWDEFFKKPRAFIFNTSEEKTFLEKRFPSVTFRGEIAGVGVDIPEDISEQRFREHYQIDSPYMLYIGRIEESKGCKELFDYFIRYKKEETGDIKLVLAGKPVMSIPEHPDIISLGFIDEKTKFDAIKGCEFLINPSPYESLSIVLLEAWSLNRPVLVTEKCNVLVEQCRRSNGGLWYRNYDEFKACVEYLLKNKNIASTCEKFVKEHYGWDGIKKKYEEILKNKEKNSSAESTEKQYGETDREKKSKMPSYAAALFPYIAAIVLCSLILFFVMNLGRADMNIPFMYDGDGLNAQAVIFKGIIDNGWYVTNNSLGAPYGSKEYDFMVCQNLNLHCFFIKIFSFFSKSYGFIMNIYFLLAFIFITVTSLYVFLRFKIFAPVAITTSLLFTFLPYHFFRGEGHFFLGTYYIIPLAVMLILELYNSPVILYRENYKKIVTCVIICILTGCDFIYHPFFTCYFLLAAGLLYSISSGKINYLLNSLILTGIISGIIFLNLSPNIIYTLQNGVNAEASSRNLEDGELYSLKITQLLLPETGHRLDFLAEFKNKYNSTAPLVTENDTASLGLIGSIGFLILLAQLLYGKTNNGLIKNLSFLNIAALLLATTGGFGSLFNYLIFSKIRSYNRISVYIAFFSLFTTAVLLNEFYKKYINSRDRKIGFYIFITFILVTGILDQTNLGFIPDYNGTKSEYINDRNFINKIEASVSKNAMIFQLPYAPYPEWPAVNKMREYSHFRGYIHSKNLRWSYGAVKGRYGDLWQKALSEKSTEDFLDSIACAGFGGIYIDRYGYFDNGSNIEAKLSSLTGTKPLVSDNKRLIFFNIEEYSKKLKEKYSEKEWQMKQYEALHPILLSWGKEFFQFESDSAMNWRWCPSEGDLYITGTSQNNKRIKLEMVICTGYEEYSSLKLESDLFTDTIRVNSSGTDYSKEITVTPGKHIIKFSCDAQRVDAPGDPRYLVFRVINFKVIQQE